MDYIVTEPVIVNGVHRFRGDVLTGADAQAVESKSMLRKRVVPNRHNAPAPDSTPAPVPATAPIKPAPSAGKE